MIWLELVFRHDRQISVATSKHFTTESGTLLSGSILNEIHEFDLSLFFLFIIGNTTVPLKWTNRSLN